MELRQLRYFAAVADELNFHKAAARLHIAQPALSVQVAKLEAEIGAKLFSRERRRVHLTEAGRVFLEQAKKALADTERGVTLARQAAQGDIGQLSIGYNMPVGYRVFPKIVPAFKKKWPGVRLTFHALNTAAQQLEALRRGDLDIGFVWLPIPTDDFDIHEIVHEPIVAVIPAEHRLAKARAVSVKDLAHQPLVLFSRAADPFTYHEIEQLFLNVGATMNVVYHLENSLSMLNFVAMGLGCSLLPDYTRGIHQQGVVHKRVKPPNLVKNLVVVKKKGHGGLAETFFNFTVENMRRTGHTGRKKAV